MPHCLDIGHQWEHLLHNFLDFVYLRVGFVFLGICFCPFKVFCIFVFFSIIGVYYRAAPYILAGKCLSSLQIRLIFLFL